MDGEAAPAGADFHHAVLGLKRKLAADPIELGDGRLLQRRRRLLEDSAGIGPGGVEEQGEEVVAQIVMGVNVLSAAAARVAVE